MPCGNWSRPACRPRLMVAPVIPAINDAEIERILEAVAAAGVRNAGYVLLRLPLEMRDLFREWLIENFPDRCRPRLQAHPRHARRQGLRFDFRQADDRLRPDRLDDRPPLRGRLRAARLQCDQASRPRPSISAAAAGDRSSSICFSVCRSPQSSPGSRSGDRVADRVAAWSSWPHESQRRNGTASAARLPLDEEIAAADVPPRALGAQARRMAGRRLRRGGPGAARRAGGRRRRHSRSRRCAARARRFETADAGAARGALRTHLRAGPGRGGDGAAVAHRPRQYFARLVVGAGARGAWRCR